MNYEEFRKATIRIMERNLTIKVNLYTRQVTEVGGIENAASEVALLTLNLSTTREKLMKQIREFYNESEKRRISNANGAQDKDINAFYKGQSAICRQLLKEATCY